MPFPKSALATVPLIPFAPPVPLPCPGPAGMSNDPVGAAYNFAPCLPVPGSPLGSPNPPVCIFWTATFTVGVWELPVGVKSPVCTSCGRAPPTASFNCGGAKFVTSIFGASTGFGASRRISFGMILRCRFHRLRFGPKRWHRYELGYVILGQLQPFGQQDADADHDQQNER